MKKKEAWPKHKMGKYTDYEVFKNGDIKVAPMYIDRFKKIAHNEATVDALLKAITKHCHELLAPVVKEKSSVWKDLGVDLGVDFNKGKYLIDFNTGILSKAKEEAAHG